MTEAYISNTNVAALADIVCAESLEILNGSTLANKLCRVDFSNEVAVKGKSVQVPRWTSNFAVNTKTEKHNVTLQETSSELIDIHLDQHKEISFLIEDITSAQSSINVLSERAKQAIKDMGAQLDKDLFTLLATGENYTFSGSAIMVGQVYRDMSKTFFKGNIPDSDRFAVLCVDDHDIVANFDELKNVTYVGQSAIDVNKYGVLPPYKTFETLRSNHIPMSSITSGSPASTQAYYDNAFFWKNAVALVTRPLPKVANNFGGGSYQTVMEENGLPIRVTMSYNPNALGVQVTLDCLYGLKIVHEDGVYVVSTATEDELPD